MDAGAVCAFALRQSDFGALDAACAERCDPERAVPDGGGHRSESDGSFGSYVPASHATSPSEIALRISNVKFDPRAVKWLSVKPGSECQKVKQAVRHSLCFFIPPIFSSDAARKVPG